MLFTINASSGQPVYLQLMQQIRHAVETGVLQPGDALPAIRTLAQQLVVSPNTVVKAYTELERDGVLAIRHGSGAYIAARRAHQPRADRMRSARDRVRALVARLQADGLSDEEIQRLFEAELLYGGSAARSRGNR